MAPLSPGSILALLGDPAAAVDRPEVQAWLDELVGAAADRPIVEALIDRMADAIADRVTQRLAERYPDLDLTPAGLEP